jgi:competence protein ComGC
VSKSSTTNTSTKDVVSEVTLEDAIRTVELVKEQINQYDIKSSQYKVALRSLTTATTTANNQTNDSNDSNSLTIEWVKVCQNKYTFNKYFWYTRRTTLKLTHILQCFSFSPPS